jgi:SAM-dependent methyltransferase
MGLDYQPFTTHRRDVLFVRANITKGLPLRSSEFDNVVMLAVLEHLAEPKAVLREAFRILAPGGSLVMTWPAAKLDPILDILEWLGLFSKEMESAKHQERIPAHDLIAMLRGIGFATFLYRRFELGLNNLLVAWKSC